MGTEYVGRAPPSVIRVAICTNSECEEVGVPIEVPDDQPTYTCSCGQVINTIRYNQKAHEKSAALVQREKDACVEETVRWCYAPQLALDKDDGEPLC